MILDQTTPQTTVRPGLSLVPVGETLWRVTRTSGDVLGYIESVGTAHERRFSARRVVSSHGIALPLGEFWRVDDAIDCFRLS
jgi:hypothetical protein